MAQQHGVRTQAAGPADRRTEILGVAAELFARSSYASTSLRDIADATGILPGSLYHHFDSKEAVAVELVEAMHQDMGIVASRFADQSGDALAVLRSFAGAVAEVADRHRAAVKLSMYDAPATVSSVLSSLVRAEPPGLDQTWRALVERAAGAGAIRVPEVDPGLLSSSLRHSTLAAGLLAGRTYAAGDVADYLCTVLLDGLVLAPPAEPGASPVTVVVAEISQRWHESVTAPAGSRREQILEVGRSEFARRGFEATTMRDIAEAVGMKPASLYRHFDSKNTLLQEIVTRFSRPLLAAFQEVVAAAATPTEALDGLISLMAHAGQTFRHEFDIVKAWWRVHTPAEPAVAPAENRERFRILREVLADGVARGEFRQVDRLGLLTTCTREILWVPFHETGERAEGIRTFLRQVVELGAAGR